MGDITVLTFVDRIACFHTLKPFLFSPRGKRFRYTDSPDWCLRRDRNRILVMVRQFLKPDRVDIELMKKLRDKYERIVFFHDDAGGGIPRLEVLPYVDLLYHKALFKDRNLYTRSLYGKELFSDYYHEKYGVADPDARTRAVITNPADFEKLRLSWNIGIGDFPKHTLRQRIAVAAARATGPRAVKPFHHGDGFLKRNPQADPVAANRGLYGIHARLGLISRPSIGYQRRLILDRIAGNPRFLVGEVSQKQYNAEIAGSKIILSPFGWGELCFRDFEAVLSGALLLKPDMSHLETWPDVFVPGETYVPFSWDAEDLVEKGEYYLANDAERKRIARNAFDCYRSQVQGMEARFEGILAEIEGKV
jgi:hypothetical protein